MNQTRAGRPARPRDADPTVDLGGTRRARRGRAGHVLGSCRPEGSEAAGAFAYGQVTRIAS
ncbi:hypothetical protein ACWEPC_50555 [Nonomuraea sp. NPDC004297]